MLDSWKTFPIRLTQEDHLKLTEAAKAEGLTLERFILQALTEKIEKQGKGE